MRTTFIKGTAASVVAIGLLGALTVAVAAPANAAVAFPSRVAFALDSAKWKMPTKADVTQADIEKIYCTIGATCPVRIWSKTVGGDLKGLTVISAGRTADAANANKRAAQVLIETKAAVADGGFPKLTWQKGKTDGVAWQLGTLTVKTGEGSSASTIRIRALVAVRTNRMMTVLLMQDTQFVSAPQPMIKAVSRSLKNNTALPLVKGPVRGLISVEK